jgi:predicted TIM-barrel fold metal-dependent hydrolase
MLSPDAWDCHAHVFGPVSRFPFAEPRAYTPTEASVEALTAHLEAFGSPRVVLVQPSPYGVDDGCLVDAQARLGDRSRMVVAAGGDLAKRRDQQACGVRGWRHNPLGRLGVPGAPAIAQLKQVAADAAHAGVSLEVAIDPGEMTGWLPTLSELPCTLVIPHFAGLLAASQGPEPVAIAALLQKGRAWLKLTGADRFPAALANEHLEETIVMLVRTAPDRLVWGSDWPHTPLHRGVAITGDSVIPNRLINLKPILVRILDVLGAHAKRVLCDNPARLYG